MFRAKGVLGKTAGRQRKIRPFCSFFVDGCHAFLHIVRMAKNKKKKKNKKPVVHLHELSTRKDIVDAVKKVYFGGEKPQEADQRAAFIFLVGIVSYNLDKSLSKK